MPNDGGTWIVGWFCRGSAANSAAQRTEGGRDPLAPNERRERALARKVAVADAPHAGRDRRREGLAHDVPARAPNRTADIPAAATDEPCKGSGRRGMVDLDGGRQLGPALMERLEHRGLHRGDLVRVGIGGEVRRQREGASSAGGSRRIPRRERGEHLMSVRVPGRVRVAEYGVPRGASPGRVVSHAEVVHRRPPPLSFLLLNTLFIFFVLFIYFNDLAYTHIHMVEVRSEGGG